MQLTFDAHPRLVPAAFVTRFPVPLGELPSTEEVLGFHELDAAAPVTRSEDRRAAVRDLLRHGGHKPTGRGKPSCEYLIRAAEGDGLPRINLAVDTCNAVSLHAGLPISVVDLAKAPSPFRVGVVEDGHYVFNPSGQELSLKGMLCLHDAEGPCANAVKDAQRTKTDAGTRETLTVLWGPVGFEADVAQAMAWYRQLLEGAGATTESVVGPAV